MVTAQPFRGTGWIGIFGLLLFTGVLIVLWGRQGALPPEQMQLVPLAQRNNQAISELLTELRALRGETAAVKAMLSKLDTHVQHQSAVLTDRVGQGNYQKDLQMLAAAYEATGDPIKDTASGMMSSLLPEEHKEMVDAGMPVRAHIYGEMNHVLGMKLFQEYPDAFKPGNRFYDIGSGTGKMVAVAWISGLNATGIEFSRARYMKACSAIEKLTAKPVGGLDMIHGNALRIDFSDGDFVFSNNLMFDKDMLNGMSNIARGLKPGSVIVSSLDLPNPEDEPPLFERIHETTLPEVQDVNITFRIQRRTTNSISGPMCGPSLTNPVSCEWAPEMGRCKL